MRLEVIMGGVKPNRSIVDGKKMCNDCKNWFPADLDNFNKAGKNKNGTIRFNPYCKKCLLARDRNREYDENGISRRKLSRYKKTKEEVKELQDRKYCECCGIECLFGKKFKHHERAGQIDHHHDSNFVRGLLCRNCNLALGQLKESPEIIDSLKKYIIKYNKLMLSTNK